MLYIDNPVHTGYSHSPSGHRARQEEFGEDLYEFVVQFYKLFPDLKSRDLYVGGQSYAGKYAIVLGHKLYKAIENEQLDIPFRGIYLGSPLFVPELMFPESFEYLYNVGVISDNQRVHMKSKMQKLVNAYIDGERNSSSIFFEAIPILFKYNGIMAYKNYYTDDNTYITPTIRPIMNSDRVRRAVHVGNLTYVAYTPESDQLYADLMSNVTDKLGELLDAGKYKVLIYTGDVEIVVSNAAVEAGLLATPWRGLDDYKKTGRDSWLETPASGDNKQRLYGYFSKTGQLCRVTLLRTGKEAPHDQLEVTREMMAQFHQHGCVGGESGVSVESEGSGGESGVSVESEGSGGE